MMNLVAPPTPGPMPIHEPHTDVGQRRRVGPGFTLVELLVVIAIIAVLVGVLLPTLGRSRQHARTVACMVNQRSLTTAWSLYAGDYKDRAMPCAYWAPEDIGTGEQVFWWGTHGTRRTAPTFSRGFIAPYVDASLALRGVFDCPSQPWGTYRPQGPSAQPTSTYGYNGYYLSPAKTPGWGSAIGFRPWRRTFEILRPSDLFVFADAMLPGDTISNTALLDPPLLYESDGTWSINESPTTSFRHQRNAVTARADGSVRSLPARPDSISDDRHQIGAASGDNSPYYVPDAATWP